MLGATHGKIGLAVVIAAASAAIGCLDSANVSVWDPHDVCAKAPKSYEALPAEVSAADQNGQSVPESDPRAAVVVRIERRDCMFRANVTKGRSTGVFGPYESIQPGDVDLSPGGGGFVIVGRRPKAIGVTVNGVQDPTHEDVGRPMISRNGQHVAYLAQDGEETSVWVDGKWAQRGKGATALDQLLGILDDGRAAYLVKTGDGRKRLVVGEWSSLPFDSLQSQAVWRGERFTAFLLRGTQWEAVVDGWTEPVKGQPTSTVFFSADGAHWGYTVYRGDLPVKAYELVLDGAATVLPTRGDTAPGVTLFGTVPVYYFYPGRVAANLSPGGLPVSPSAQNDEAELVIVGARTPGASPSSDEWTKRHAGRSGQYVQIGASRGPQFDVVVADSLRIDEQGRVHYRGRRSDMEYYLIDNVIQRFAPGGSAPERATARVAMPDVPLATEDEDVPAKPVAGEAPKPGAVAPAKPKGPDAKH